MVWGEPTEGGHNTVVSHEPQWVWHPYSVDRMVGNMMRTVGIIIGTAVLTLAAIAAFLRILFRELEKADEYDGF